MEQRGIRCARAQITNLVVQQPIEYEDGGEGCKFITLDREPLPTDEEELGTICRSPTNVYICEYIDSGGARTWTIITGSYTLPAHITVDEITERTTGAGVIIEDIIHDSGTLTRASDISINSASFTDTAGATAVIQLPSSTKPGINFTIPSSTRDFLTAGVGSLQLEKESNDEVNYIFKGDTHDIFTIRAETVVGNKTPRLETSGDMQCNNVDLGTATWNSNYHLYVDNSYTGSVHNGTRLNPFTNIQDALDRCGNNGNPSTPADNDEAKRMCVVEIMAGSYDQDLIIPYNRLVTLRAHGIVVIGDGALDYLKSTTARNIHWNFSEDAGLSSVRICLSLESASFVGASTHLYYGQSGFCVSGDIIIRNDIANIGTTQLFLSGVRLEGTVSQDTSTGYSIGSPRLYLDNCDISNAINAPLTLARCFYTRFKSDVTVTYLGQMINCEWGNMSFTDGYLNVVPYELLNCQINGTMTSTNVVTFYADIATARYSTITVAGNLTIETPDVTMTTL